MRMEVSAAACPSGRLRADAYLAVAAAGGHDGRMTTRAPLADRALSYQDPGATCPAAPDWTPPAGYRSYDAIIRIGTGDAYWQAASAAVLAWGVKTRSGFTVQPDRPHGVSTPASGSVHTAGRYWLLAHLGPVTIREPAQVVAVVDDADRRGFAYGTLHGHPVSGEEAFILSRDADGAVHLTLRSLTRPGLGWWRMAFPGALVAQRMYRRRYQRALVALAY
jgi:uncharacterized protein (UPF0548 family)